MKRLIRSVRDRLNAGTEDWESAQAIAATPATDHGDLSSPSPPNPVRLDALFQYTPLTSALSFRILYLKQTPRDLSIEYDKRPLHGSLVQASIEAPPEYRALSYTWGDPAPCETVEIDGRRLGITANCASALRHIMRYDSEIYIWVDSICINQANTPDALQERSGQVTMMGQIYRNAIQVNVYLGAGDVASDVACEALVSLYKHCLLAMTPGPQQEDFKRKYEDLADDVLALTPEFPYGKLHGIFRLPWFRRCWVFQEVVLGRMVLFYCGKHLLQLKIVSIGADFKRLPYSKYNSLPFNSHWRMYLNNHEIMQEFIRQKEDGEPLSGFNLTLSRVLLAPALYLEATRPEDKIYGLYGVCKRLGFELPAPDYSKPLATVYTEAMRSMLSYEAGLDILSAVCESPGWSRGLPSWVPDFSGCIRKWSPSNPPHMIVYDRKNPRISGHTRCQYDFVLDGSALSLRGRRLDMLCAVGKPWTLDTSKTMLGDCLAATGEDISSLLGCIGSWFDVVQGRGDCSQERVVMQLLVQLLTQDYSQPFSPERLEELCRYLSVLVSASRSGGDPRHMALADPQDSPRDYLLVGGYVVSEGVKSAVASVVVNTWKSVFRTAAGYLGLGTHTVQDGDVVAVFHGGTFAAVLRPWENWFRYVGPAYVDGVMNGEFWDASSTADDEWFVLV